MNYLIFFITHKEEIKIYIIEKHEKKLLEKIKIYIIPFSLHIKKKDNINLTVWSIYKINF